MNRRTAVGLTLLAVSLGIIVVATLLPISPNAPGELLHTWCLKCGGLWLTDVISNVALFLPLGIALIALRVGLWPTVVVSTLLSCAIELSQSMGLPPGRSAALADILANSCGGAFGAALAVGWQYYSRPIPRFSATLALLWATLSAVILLATSFALSPRPVAKSLPLVLVPSTFTHVPGSGWYEDIVDSVVVESTRVQRGWPGPVILSASRNTDSISAYAFVQGRDETNAFVPIVYVHVGTDTSPILALGVHGRDAELRTTRRAWDFGLNFPILKLNEAFSGQVFRDGKPLRLQASIARDALQLSVTSVSKRDSVALSLTPLLGWALIQTVITINSPGEFVAAFLWVFALMAPIGWWSARSTGRRMRTVLACAVVIVAGIVGGPMLLRIATPSLLEMGVVAVCAITGYLVSAWILKR